MSNIRVGRYTHPSVTKEWQGWIEPDDQSWIAFIKADGSPVFYLNRDQETGAVVEQQ